MSSSSYLRQALDGMTLVKGFGGQDCCSIQAINRVLHCRDTDSCPPGMSSSMHQWIIVANDTMSNKERNSAWWKDLLVRAAACKNQDVSDKWIMDKWFREEVLPLCERIKDPLLAEFIKEPTRVNAERLHEAWIRSVNEYVFLARRLRDWVLGDNPMRCVVFMMGIGIKVDPFVCLERMVNVQSTGR